MRLLDMANNQYVSAYDVATVYAALDDRTRTVEWLHKAIEQRAQPVNFVAVAPAFNATLLDETMRNALLHALRKTRAPV